MEKVKINIVPKGVKKACYLSQNDNGRVVRFELFNELVPYTLDGSETITVTVVRPDGEEIVSSVPNTEAAYIDVTFNDDMSAIAGVGAGEIKITDGETVLGSHNFDINVEIDAYNGKDVVIETETGTLLSFNTEVEDNALEYESEIPYNAEGYTGLRVINSRTAPVYNKTPYLFRKTPSGSGNSCIEKLTGLSVAFNQLVENGNFEDTTGWGSSNYTQIANNNTMEITKSGDGYALYKVISVPTNHKVLKTISVKGISGVTYYFNGQFPNYIGTGNWETITRIVINNEANNYFNFKTNEASDYQTVYIKNIMYIDLTSMLGTTLADYIYSFETAQAGAGVAYFKALFGADYYPFNAGELLSSKPVSKKVVGKNFFNYDLSDAGSIVKYIPLFVGNGVFTMSSNAPLVEGAAILFILAGNVSSGASTGTNGVSSGIPRTVTTTDGYITIGYRYYGNPTVYPDVYNTQIEYGNQATEYEPYSEETYNLGGDELRGVLKLDANNNIFAYGDIKTSDGKIKRILKELNLTSQNWSNITSLSDYAYIMLADRKAGSNLAYFANLPSSILRSRMNDANQCYVLEFAAGTFNSTEELKTALSNSKLIYELATPTSESADPFTDPQEVKVTEEFIDGRAVEIPVGHDTIYGTDIEYLDIDFDTTIFGGNINAVDGVLSSEYNSDGSVKPTPEIIDITPTPIPVRAGDNVIFNSAEGNQTIRYYNQVE